MYLLYCVLFVHLIAIDLLICHGQLQRVSWRTDRIILQVEFASRCRY